MANVTKEKIKLGALIQDAFHYAVAANGGYYCGYESAFVGHNATHTRSQYMRMALAQAKEAFGFSLTAGPAGLGKTLDFAPALADKILFLARGLDIAADGGELLCQECRKHGARDGWKTADGLCEYCWEKARNVCMDPNENLAEQRRLVAVILDGDDGRPNYYADLQRAADRLAELVEALDEWLCNGGFLPTAWKGTQP